MANIIIIISGTYVLRKTSVIYIVWKLRVNVKIIKLIYLTESS